jgi:PPK2 family polyphosphate:nucleotide phosphotransferase
MSDIHRVTPGEPVRLAEMPTRADGFADDRGAAEKEFKDLRKELARLQYRFYADGRHKVLVVLQAMDAGGKDGTIRRVFQGVNPQGVRVTSFKAPSKEELAHDYLWRIHKAVPRQGMIGVFNRSHYEDVLIVRVDGLAPDEVWQARYEQINRFEKLLAETGTTIVKIYLHISKEEQRGRFQDRLDEPEKNWKFSREDLHKRTQWEDYMAAYEDAVNRCSTPWAPWYVIPADQKWYRNLAITRILLDRIEALEPRFPAPEEGLDRIEIV